MKKIPILIIMALLPLQAYSFWIWSPKTQKWKNPKYSALATPYLQFKEAEKIFEGGDYTRAYKEFKKLLVQYPDSKEAAEAQYYLARSLEKLDKQYQAFQEYSKLVSSYPNSQRINEAVERQYNIGEFFLNREYKQMLGMSVYDFVEHPSIEIFNAIVTKVPYSEYAPRAQYKLGMIFSQLNRYDEARDAFQKVIDNYSDSEWAAPAKYQLALATSKAFPGADYDSTYLAEASKRLDEFIKDHPEAQISSQAQDQLKDLRNREAKKIFDIAEFYERQSKYESALLYYRKVASTFPDSDYNELSRTRIKELEEMLKGTINTKELKQREKNDASIRLKSEKQKEKQEKLQARRERARLKREEKLRLTQEKKMRAQAAREEKLKKKEETQAAKKQAEESIRETPAQQPEVPAHTGGDELRRELRIDEELLLKTPVPADEAGGVGAEGATVPGGLDNE